MLNTISATFGRAALAVLSVLTDPLHFPIRAHCCLPVLTRSVHLLGPVEEGWSLRCWHTQRICFRFKWHLDSSEGDRRSVYGPSVIADDSWAFWPAAG